MRRSARSDTGRHASRTCPIQRGSKCNVSAPQSPRPPPPPPAAVDPAVLRDNRRHCPPSAPPPSVLIPAAVFCSRLSAVLSRRLEQSAANNRHLCQTFHTALSFTQVCRQWMPTAFAEKASILDRAPCIQLFAYTATTLKSHALSPPSLPCKPYFPFLPYSLTTLA